MAVAVAVAALHFERSQRGRVLVGRMLFPMARSQRGRVRSQRPVVDVAVGLAVAALQVERSQRRGLQLAAVAAVEALQLERSQRGGLQLELSQRGGSQRGGLQLA